MNRMVRTFIIMLTLVVFATNMIAVAAWAAPLQHGESMVMKADANVEEPCPMHRQDNSGDAQKHQKCPGLCLCDHVHYSPAFIFRDADKSIPQMEAQSFMIEALMNMAGFSTAPPVRPPKPQS